MKTLKNNVHKIVLAIVFASASFNVTTDLYGMFPQCAQGLPGSEIPVTEVEDDVETQEEMQARIMKKKKEREERKAQNGRPDQETVMVSGSN
ncbi:MAG: hypothetical protein ABH827_00645 [bacterium]